MMKKRIATYFIAGCALSMGALAPFTAWAQSELSQQSALSAMPIASVVGASAGVVIAVPVAFSTVGAVLVVKSVELSAQGTVYAFERLSDGARASVEVSGKAANAASAVLGDVVTVSIIGAGVVLSVAGAVIALIPNEMGRALMHNQRVTL